MEDKPLLIIEMLGTFRILVDDRELPKLASRKAASLLAYLALHPGLPLHREKLIDLLWPESHSDAARHNLRQALYSIRRELNAVNPVAATALRCDSTNISIGQTLISTDVLQMEALIYRAAQIEDAAEKARILERAAFLYRGDLLPGIYDDWATGPRQSLERKAVQMYRDLITALMAGDRPNRAIEHAERLSALEPLGDAAHAALIRLYRLAGHPQRAQAAYNAFEVRLMADADSEPSEEVRQALACPFTSLAPVQASPDAVLSETPRRHSLPGVDRAGMTRMTRIYLMAAVALALVFTFDWAATRRFLVSPPPVANHAVMTGQEAEAVLAQIHSISMPGLNAGGPRSRESVRLCRRLAQASWSAWYGPEEQVWIQRIQSASAWMRASLAWSVENDPEACIELAGNLTRY